jgi:thiamine pyrophosphate-dependent acetolactate synthase large subunit-like protein
MFGSAECVLALGIDRAEDVDSSLWRRGNPKSIIYVQSLEPPADSAEADACIHMSVDDFCSRMLDSVRGARDASWAADVVARVQKAKERSAGSQRSCAPSLGRVDPLALVAFLKELLRPSDIVVADVGIHKHVLGILHECPRPKTFVCSSGLGVMGFALPAAIGAHFAIPKRRIVVVAGDGGFHSTSQELETASRFRVPLLVIVWKDGAFGLIRRYQELGAARRTPGMWRFGDVDFVKLAEANGCRGFRANSLPELREAFAKCNRANLPAVIEVPVDYRQFYGGD